MRVGGRNGAVGPHFESELVVIGDLSETRGFDGVIALANRRVDGVDRNESDAEIFVEVLVGGDIAAATLQTHFHIEFAAFADGGDVDVFIEDFDVGVGFDHAGGDDAGLVSAQVDRFWRIAGELEGNLLQIQDDVGRIFDYARDRLEFVQHAFDFYRGDGRAFDRGQHYAAKSVADGGAEAAFKGLGPEHAIFSVERRGI